MFILIYFAISQIDIHNQITEMKTENSKMASLEKIELVSIRMVQHTKIP